MKPTDEGWRLNTIVYNGHDFRTQHIPQDNEQAKNVRVMIFINDARTGGCCYERRT